MFILDVSLFVKYILPHQSALSEPSTSPDTLTSPVTPNVLPSNVKLASPFNEFESVAVTTLLLTPLERSANVLPQTLESISSVFTIFDEFKTSTVLSVPVPVPDNLRPPFTSVLVASIVCFDTFLIIKSTCCMFDVV